MQWIAPQAVVVKRFEGKLPRPSTAGLDQSQSCLYTLKVTRGVLPSTSQAHPRPLPTPQTSKARQHEQQRSPWTQDPHSITRAQTCEACWRRRRQPRGPVCWGCCWKSGQSPGPWQTRSAAPTGPLRCRCCCPPGPPLHPSTAEHGPACMSWQELRPVHVGQVGSCGQQGPEQAPAQGWKCRAGPGRHAWSAGLWSSWWTRQGSKGRGAGCSPQPWMQLHMHMHMQVMLPQSAFPDTLCLCGLLCRVCGAKPTFCGLVDHPLGCTEHQGAVAAARQASAQLQGSPRLARQVCCTGRPDQSGDRPLMLDSRCSVYRCRQGCRPPDRQAGAPSQSGA